MPAGAYLHDPLTIKSISGDDATAQHSAGCLAVSSDGTIYRYCLATVAWTVVDGALRQAAATNGYDLAPTSTTAAGEQVLGAAVAAVTIAHYGWATAYGKVAAMVAATGGWTAQLAIVGGVTASRMLNYASATHTAAGPAGTALETKAADAAGAVILRCL